MEKTLVALATFNERDNLPELVEAVFSELPEAEILVIDDNSPDGTGTWCDQYLQTEQRFHVIHRSKKLGLGSATIMAMNFAITNQYDLFITMDADWSHHPRHLKEIFKRLVTEKTAAEPEVEVVIGSRYCPGGAISGWPLSRRVMSLAINSFARSMLGQNLTDLSGAYRAYKVSTLRKLNLDTIEATGYAYLEEILWHLKQTEAYIVEVPITFEERRTGESKISFLEAFSALITILKIGTRKDLKKNS